MKLAHTTSIAALFACSLSAASAHAQCELTTLQPPPETFLEDQYGESAAILGDLALVGAPHDSDIVFKGGSAHVFERINGVWTHTAILESSDIGYWDHVGEYCAILNQDLVLIGAKHNDSVVEGTGAAYVFERVGGAWVETHKLVPSDGGENDRFGYALSIQTDRCAIGSVSHRTNGIESAGAVYVYDFDGTSWVETAKVVPDQPNAVALFGDPVLLDGDKLYVGALGALGEGATAAENVGALYEFELQGGQWVQTQKLLASDAAFADRFGIYFAKSGDRLMVCADKEDNGGLLDAGAVYVFEHTGTEWAEVAKLAPMDLAARDQFGYSVGLIGDVAMIGANYDDDAGDESGSAYCFQKFGDRWLQTGKWTEPVPLEGEKFGHFTCASETDFLVASSRHDAPTFPSGGAYVTGIGDFPSSYCQTSPNSAGPGAAIGMFGSPSITQDDFNLLAMGGIPGQFGLFYYGPEQDQLPFGEGVRCVAPGALGVFRLNPPQTMDGAGELTLQVDFDAPPAGTAPGQITAGSRWNFQFWYRDPAGGGAGFNLSDALGVTFCP